VRQVRPTISRSMRVLVVGPDAKERRETMGRLHDATLTGEIELRDANSVEHAMQAFQSHHPDLLLISTRSIETLGRVVARRIRQMEGVRHTGIIFVDRQGGDDGAHTVSCLEMGADDYVRPGSSDQELMARMRAVLRLKAMTDELRIANHKLRILSMTDELTGLANMRSFTEQYSEALRRCRRGRMALGVIMLDIDHFKNVNDSTNHLMGSYVLGAVGQIMRTRGALPSSDLAARYGGDEFIILCESESQVELEEKAEKVRDIFSREVFERDGQLVCITASFGAAWVAKGYTGRGDTLIKAADMMLYKSKENGRNRVTSMTLPQSGEFELEAQHSNTVQSESAKSIEERPLRLIRG
jgi:diguanylate cyclase (GGDEF)-like protein